MKCFISYSTAARAIAGNLRRQLAEYSIESFLAQGGRRLEGAKLGGADHRGGHDHPAILMREAQRTSRADLAAVRQWAETEGADDDRLINVVYVTSMESICDALAQER